MRIGIKLELGWRHREDTRQLFGDREPLTALRALGVEAVELPVTAGADEARLERDLARLRQGGMHPSLHPYTEGTPQSPALFVTEHARGRQRGRQRGRRRGRRGASDRPDPCRAFHRRVLDAAQSAAQQAAHPVVVNVHPAAGPPAMTRDALFRRSVAFFRWLLAEREARSPDVWVVAELQGPPLAGEDVIRVGDTYDELLCLADATGVALCWDLGHAVLSHRHRDAPLDPPDAFLRRVAHVHCHDLREQDHRPLLYDGVPWRRFLRNLRDTGFDGTVVLEVPPGRFLDLEAPGFDALARSLSSLRETIGLAGGR